MATAKKSPAAQATKQVEAAVAAGKESLEQAVKAGTDAAQQNYEKAVAVTREQVEAAAKASSDAFKSYEDIVSFQKDNLDAVVKSSDILVKGLQEMNKAIMGLAKASMEESVATTKKLMACKDPKEAFALQSSLAKASYEKTVSESKKISDMSVKLAESVAAPINSRLTVTVEKLSKPIAA